VLYIYKNGFWYDRRKEVVVKIDKFPGNAERDVGQQIVQAEILEGKTRVK